MVKCQFCDSAAEDAKFCKKHSKEFELFNEKKKEMEVSLEADMRVIERMIKLNPELVHCPSCGSSISVHHWQLKGEIRTPIFKCPKCRFIG